MRPFPLLSSPIALGPVTVPNRVVLLPHGTLYADNGFPTARHRDYYLERARGGVGLIITESQIVHPRGGHGPMVIDASNAEAMAQWTAIVDAVHRAGARLFAQLSHFGNEAHSAHSLMTVWGPSVIASPVSGENSVRMTVGDIAELIGQFERAAILVRQAGFDGVELKVGHDGIMRQFLSPLFNDRDDEYGGDLKARLRIVFETLAAIRSAVCPQLAVGVRLCLDEGLPGGYHLEDGLGFAELLSRSGLIDYISADGGTLASQKALAPPMRIAEGANDETMRRLRTAADGLPVIAYGGLRTPGHAERLLATGGADLIGMARQLITDPQWAQKAFSGRADEIRPCVGCNQACLGHLGHHLPVSCVHNPAAGREQRLGLATLTKAARPRTVVVAGGGPAGLKAAEVAARRGHLVTLMEASDMLGGQVAVAASSPGHERWGDIVSHLAREVERLGVDVRLGSVADVQAVIQAAPDALIWAAGALPGTPPFEYDADASVFDEWAVMNGAGPRRARVVVVDFGVRFEAAALVETLVGRDCEVTWVGGASSLPADIDPATRADLLPRIAGVRRMPETRILSVAGHTVTLRNVFTDTAAELTDVAAVVVVGNKVAVGPPAGLDSVGVELHVIGDSAAPRQTTIAIYEGEIAGRAV
jgi:2,4-dienoyl-CoA reductase-like NADH-dependent reductase (Old Yellow Enzyme family)/thioredoxin reductase